MADDKPTKAAKQPKAKMVRVQINPAVRSDVVTFGKFKGAPGDVISIPQEVAERYDAWESNGVKVLGPAPAATTLPPKDTAPTRGTPRER